ncbi:hypothetical protein AZH53_05045 [Methanomicrobiaceae archaeon CYW5]|nr:hypothetical protein [Methanovulcanius yangii]
MKGTSVKRADILTLLAAVLILLAIAGAAPHIRAYFDMTDGQETPQFIPPVPTSPGEQPPKPFSVWQIQMNTNHSSIYASGPGGYPVLDFPDEMNIFGASDAQSPVIWPAGEERQFAEYSGRNSGFSKIFEVPYSIWRVRADIVTRTQPQNAVVDWIIIDAVSGEIVTGNSIAYGGQVTKNIQGSGRYYFVVSNQDADSYHFTLETTRAAFGAVFIEPEIRHLNDYLNAL